MKTMTSLERVTAVMEGQIPDRVPVALHNFLMTWRMAGRTFDEICGSGEALAEAQLTAWREFGHDVIMHENGVCAEAAAMGAVVHLQPDQPPHIAEPLIKELNDIEKLRIPDPETTYPLNELLKATRIIARETKGQVFINGRADQGPIALACALCGPEQFLIKLMEPGLYPWIHRLLDICSQMNIALGLAQRRAGAHSSTIGLAGTSLISPETFDEFEGPRAAAFCRAMREAGCYSHVHACGRETHLLDNLVATGASALELDPGTEPQACKNGVGNRATVLGMLDPAHIINRGTVDQVREHVRQTLGIMAPGGRFLIGPGCALPSDSKIDNIHALMDCVRSKGVYAADGSLPALRK